MPDIVTVADINAKASLDKLLDELPDYVRTFINAKMASKSVRTLAGYAQDIKSFLFYISKSNPEYKDQTLSQVRFDDIASMDAHDIEEYISFIKYYDSSSDESVVRMRHNGDDSIRRKVAAISSFYNYYYKLDEIPGNPVRKYELPKRKDKDIVILEDDEVEILLSALKEQSLWDKNEMKYHVKTRCRDLALYTLLLSTGLRISEASGLDIEDLDFTHEQFRIRRKGGKYQLMGMNSEVVSALSDYIQNERPSLVKDENEKALFCSIRKQRLSVRQIEAMTKTINMKLFPLKHITPHKMRSTFGTRLQREHGDIYLTASALGHSDVATTKKHYAKMDQDKVTDALRNHKL